jgi:hypothetical protein
MHTEHPAAHLHDALSDLDPSYDRRERYARAHELLDAASRALTRYSETADERDSQDVSAYLWRVGEVWEIDLDALDAECSVAVRWYALRSERWALNVEFEMRQWRNGSRG